MKVSKMPNLKLIDVKQGQGEIDANMEVDLLSLLGKALSAFCK